MSEVSAALALLVALPILGATLPLAVGLVRERAGWVIALAVLVVEAILAAIVAWSVYGLGETRLTHNLAGGTFARIDGVGVAIGIELVADHLSAIVVLLVGVVSLATLVYTRIAGPRGNAFYSGYLLLTGGLMGVTLTHDLFNMFVFLEIVGLATYALVASDRSAESAVAALKYLIVGTAGASLFLIGVGYLYVSTGMLNMTDLSLALAGEFEHTAALDGVEAGESLYDHTLVIAGFAFIAVGLATKAAIFPLHTWQPDAYAAAPDGVTVYISALVSTVSVYALARATLTVFTPAFFAANPLAAETLIALATVSIVAGSLLAAMQYRIDRMFAYSSVSQFGMIVAAIGLAVHPAAGPTAAAWALAGALIHLFGHGLMKGGLFLGAGIVAARTGARTITEYAGLARRQPVVAGALAVLGLALVGVPPSVGFVGKWYIGVGAIGVGIWPVAFVIFVSTLLTLVYVARIVEVAYFDDRDESAVHGDVAGDAGRSVATDGGRTTLLGALVLLVATTLLVVALGFQGAALESLFEPFVTEVVGHE